MLLQPLLPAPSIATCYLLLLSSSNSLLHHTFDICCSQLDIDDDVEFCKQIFAEESVHLLPGSCFGADNFFRVVICPPEPMLNEAWDRIELFIARHVQGSPNKKAKA